MTTPNLKPLTDALAKSTIPKLDFGAALVKAATRCYCDKMKKRPGANAEREALLAVQAVSRAAQAALDAESRRLRVLLDLRKGAAVREKFAGAKRIAVLRGEKAGVRHIPRPSATATKKPTLGDILRARVGAEVERQIATKTGKKVRP